MKTYPTDEIRMPEGDTHSTIRIGEDDFDDGPVASILYVPHVDYFPHEHIDLSVDEARRLRNWLSVFLDKYEVRL